MTIDRQHFYATIRRELGKLSQQQVDALNVLLGFIEPDIASGKITREQAAYMLATTKHETANTYEPIEEYGSKLYLSKYWWRPSLRKQLGNRSLADSWRYAGKGYVMITGRNNYTHFGLQDNPDAALEPATAWRIMRDGMLSGQFGKPLTRFVRKGRTLYKEARQSVNGTDDARLIAGYAVAFDRALRLVGDTAAQPDAPHA